ncbi:NACHT domain-containing protein [Streptomyces syringium]|uniref:NACHT domain-containing protein n=1 Tax=Streptomyces syringium TaxID=76729 RepID=UPI0036EF604E
MHPAKGRIAAVFGRSQGSGYLLTPRLVLTAGHVAGDGAGYEVQVAVPGGVGRVPCQLVWTRDAERCDAALLVAERDLVPEDTALAFEPVVWGWTDDLKIWPDAQAVGFPDVQREADGELDSEQLVGTFKPGSQLLGGWPALDSVHGAPERSGGAGTPWAGMSGAAVFVNDLLAGVVHADPGGWGHGRVTVTSTAALVSAHGFLDECAKAGHNDSYVRDLAPRPTLESDVFEEKLRKYLGEKASDLTIVGLSLSDCEGEAWPLDAAYLSLELSGAERRDVAPVTAETFGLSTGDSALRTVSSPQRAEEALAGQKRVLLRGAAGSGKTTLLQWLAATVASGGRLPPGLGHLVGCIPLTLPLRTLVREGRLPGPEEFLTAAALPLAGMPSAQGWMTRRLTEGNVLLLIDGVDEVPEADRRRTLTWLKDLLAAYPDVRYVVTTRPSAVRQGWLADAGFTELELLPMSRSDVAAFIERWHTAAEKCAPPSTGQAERDRLSAFKEALTEAVVAKPDLGRLATNPLMCALICALNRSRRGYLPHGRMELYRAALELLLVRRDREREIVVGPDGPELDQAQQVALLQKIAYWLIRNGRSEVEIDKAVEIIERALPAMPAVAARGNAQQILRHLVLRSGLLRTPTSETLDFIHRTFQDYLGARAAVEDLDFNVLVNNAHDDQWEDVLRMAIGHAAPRARAELLGLLLDRGDCEEPYRYRLHLLAAACLEHATELDPDVRARVEKAAAELVPPRDIESAKALAGAGQIVLDLLPGPEGLDEDLAYCVVVTATTVAGDRAIPLLAKYATHPSTVVRAQLAWSWDRFDTEHFADAVIGNLPYTDKGEGGLRFMAKSGDHLAALKRLGGRPEVECRGPLNREDLGDLPTPVLTHLTLSGMVEDIDLSALRSCPPLRELRIDSASVSRLDTLDGEVLRTLHLSLVDRPEALDALSGMARLRSLLLDWHSSGDADSSSIQVLSVPSGLQYLSLGRAPSADLSLSGLSRHPALRSVEFDGEAVAYRERAVLGTLPKLRALSVWHEDLRSLSQAKPLRGVTRLQLRDPSGLPDLACLPVVYPNLEKLSILNFWSADPVDLAFAQDMGPIDISLYHSGPVLHEELLPEGTRLTLN